MRSLCAVQKNVFKKCASIRLRSFEMIPLQDNNPVRLTRGLSIAGEKRIPYEFSGERSKVWEDFLEEEQIATRKTIDESNSAQDTSNKQNAKIGPCPFIVTAPSGAGKTTECVLLVERLTEKRKFAVGCEARLIVRDGFIKSLSCEEQERLKKWRITVEPLCFVIDAVDELRLENRSLHDLSSILERENLFAANVQLVFTSREDCWGSAECNWLTSLSHRAGRLGEMKHLHFDPLENSHIEPLALHYGLPESDRQQFVARFHEKAIRRLYELRPTDLKSLVEYWKAHGDFGSWSRMLQWHLRNTYGERNPSRLGHRRLSLEKYLTAVKKIAAITSLSNTRHILRPNESPIPDIPHAEDLFPDWSPEELVELFSSPLLVGKGNNAVQLPEGQLPYFLTASWISSLYAGGYSNDSLLRSLVLQPRGHTKNIVPLSRREIAGWCAALIPEVREPILISSPETILFYGDAEQLETDTFIDALQRFCTDPGLREWDWLDIDRSKIARPEFEEVVSRLLVESKHNGVLSFLISMAIFARYSKAVSSCIDIALNTAQDDHVRAYAIGLIGKLGSLDQKKKLLSLVEEESDSLRRSCFLALVPEKILFGKKLVSFLAKETDDDSSSIADVVANNGLPLTKDEMVQLASHFLSRLREDFDTKSHSYRPRTNSTRARQEIVKLSLELLAARATENEALPNVFNELAVLLEEIVGMRVFYLHEERIRRVRDALSQARIWEGIWKEKLSSSIKYYLPERHRLVPVHEDGYRLLLQKWMQARDDTEKGQIENVLWREYRRRPPEEQKVLKDNCANIESGIQLLEEFDQNIQRQTQPDSPPEEEADSSEWEALKDEWLKNIHLIESGQYLSILYWALENLDGLGHTAIDFHRAESQLGSDLSNSLRRGFIAYWRQSKPQLPDVTHNSFNLSFNAGLIGATLELSQSGAIKSLSKSEAEIASTLAMHCINGFPLWFSELRKAFPDEVETTLRNTIQTEWQTDNKNHYSVLRFAPYMEEAFLQKALAHIALELIQQAPPNNVQALHCAVDAISTQDDFPEWLDSTCRGRVEATSEQSWRMEWLRLWGISFPVKAAEWLTGKLAVDDSWKEVVLPFAASFDRTYDIHHKGKSQRLFSPESLEHWIPIFFNVFPPHSDPKHDGAHNVGTDDMAKNVRDRCIELLAGNGSIEATIVVNKLAVSKNPELRECATEALMKQSYAAAEQEVEKWTIEKILAAERESLRIPLSEEELHDVVCNDIRRVAELIEKDEFSYAELFGSRPNGTGETYYPSELTVQRWVASSLKLVSQGVYSVVRENEVQDRNRVDISAFKPSVGRIPIEIKPIGNYSIVDLQQCIKDQLLAKYLNQRDINFGVLIVVRLKSKKWQFENSSLNFSQGIDRLRDFAADLLLSHGKTISVATIDLLRSPREFDEPQNIKRTHLP
jgi:hypothetical protein